LQNIETIGGTIEIVDDAFGMTVEEIRNGWLVLGASGKEGQTKTKIFQRVPTEARSRPSRMPSNGR